MSHSESTLIETPKKLPQEAPEGMRRNGDTQPENGMIALAEKVKQVHTQPIPEATLPAPQPFPPLIWQGLLVSIAVGALAGWGFGWLLLEGTLVFSGWEGLYSMVPATFYAFWIFMGAALGIVVGGVGTILLAKPEPAPA